MSAAGRLIIDLCSGSGSASQPWIDHGWDAIRIDTEKKVRPDIVADVRRPLFRAGSVRPDVVWASPPCTEFSLARIGRRIEHPDMSIYNGCLERIAELKPRFYIIENVRGAVRCFGPSRLSDGRTWFFWGNFPAGIVLHGRPKGIQKGYTKKRGRYLPTGWKPESGERRARRSAAIPYDIADAFRRACEVWL